MYGTSSGVFYGLPASGWLFTGIPIVIALGLWVVVARSHFIRGGSVERPERVPQLYGYTVCLIAVVVMLTTLSTLIDKVFSLSDPLLGSDEMGWMTPAVTSFEAYRATYDRADRFGPGGEQRPREVVSDDELRRRYEGLRADQAARARFGARRDLTRSALLFLVAAALFWIHWRWVRAPERRWDAAGVARIGGVALPATPPTQLP